MRTYVGVAILLGLAAASVVRVEEPAWDFDKFHQFCYTDKSGQLYSVFTNGRDTNASVYDAQGLLTKTHSFPPFSAPFAQYNQSISHYAWPEGPMVAEELLRAGFFPAANASTITAAAWATALNFGWADNVTFTIEAGTSMSAASHITFSSAVCPNWNNCMFIATNGGPHCWDGYQYCCGDGTMEAQCVPNTSQDVCCTYFLAAGLCSSTSSCCGELGPGASSGVVCCEEGSTCCEASPSYDGTSSCCPEGTTCCSAASVGLCCAADEVCDYENDRCAKATPAPN
jgi:hypothetical protein